MSGELAMASTVFLVLVLILAAAFVLVAVMAKQNVELAKSSAATAARALDLVEKQQLLLSSADALTYQALRAMDYVNGYADPSTQSDVEEHAGGNGSDDGDGFEDTGFGDDPFVTGSVFSDQKL